MGLHSKNRYEIKLKSKNPTKQVDEIIQFAVAFYDFIYDYIENNPLSSMEITLKLARFISLIFTFVGFEDNEIYNILRNYSEMRRKRRERS